MYAMFDMKYNSSFPNFVLFFVILFVVVMNLNLRLHGYLRRRVHAKFRLQRPLKFAKSVMVMPS